MKEYIPKIYRQGWKKRAFWILGFSILIGVVAVLTKETLLPCLAHAQGGEKCLSYRFAPFSLINLLIFLIVAALVYNAVMRLYLWLNGNHRLCEDSAQKPRRMFLCSFALNVVVYGIWWLEYFPGTGMNDTINALMSPVGSPHLPIVYQHLIYYGVTIGAKLSGDYTIGYASVVFLQIVVMAAEIAWVVRWMTTKKIHRGIVYTAMVFYAFFPAFGDYSITLVKDVTFGLAAMALVVMLYETIDTEGESLLRIRNTTLLSLVMVVLCCTRSNGRLVVYLTAIALLLTVKKYRRRILVTLLPVVAVSLLLSMAESRNGASEVAFREMTGVPMAQIGAVLNEGGEISEADQDVLENILPLERWRENYRFSFSDTIKFDAKFDKAWLNENKFVFLRTWASILVENFPTYVKAYLYHSCEFWSLSPFNMFATDYTQSYFRKINNNTKEDSLWGVFIADLGLENRTVFPERIYKLLYDIFYLLFPMSLAFGPGMMIWCTFACVILLFVAEKGKVVLAFLPTMLIWLTMMIASPSCLIYRYSFYLLLTLPCIVVITVLELSRSVFEYDAIIKE